MIHAPRYKLVPDFNGAPHFNAGRIEILQCSYDSVRHFLQIIPIGKPLALA